MMYTEQDEEKFVAVLKEIQSRIPKPLLAKTVSDTKLSPTVEKVMQEALKSDSISSDKKQQIQNMVDSGMFSKVVSEENPKYMKMVDEFVAREIKKAQKAGKLPPQSKMKYLPSLMKIQNENKKADN